MDRLSYAQYKVLKEMSDGTLVNPDTIHGMLLRSLEARGCVEIIKVGKDRWMGISEVGRKALETDRG